MSDSQPLLPLDYTKTFIVLDMAGEAVRQMVCSLALPPGTTILYQHTSGTWAAVRFEAPNPADGLPALVLGVLPIAVVDLDKVKHLKIGRLVEAQINYTLSLP